MPKIESPEIMFRDGTYYAVSPNMYLCAETREELESVISRAMVLIEDYNKEKHSG